MSTDSLAQNSNNSIQNESNSSPETEAQNSQIDSKNQEKTQTKTEKSPGNSSQTNSQTNFSSKSKTKENSKWVFLTSALAVFTLLSLLGLGLLWQNLRQEAQANELRMRELSAKLETIERQNNSLNNQIILSQTPNSGQNTAPAQLSFSKPDLAVEPWTGPQNGRYTWIVYSDFECPFCKQAHPNLRRLATENAQQMVLVYRHMPISSIHPNAKKLAVASECAATQSREKFWPFADEVFNQMPALEMTKLGEIAIKVGLDKAKFETCLNSSEMIAKIDQAEEKATASGINSTPTHILYDLRKNQGRIVQGALPYERLKAEWEGFIRQQGQEQV